MKLTASQSNTPVPKTVEQGIPHSGTPQDARLWQRHFFLRRPTSHDFSTIAVVGQGAYGMVRVVRDKTTDAVFALKQMSKADLAFKSGETLIIQEINVLYRASTPWIPKLYYAWQDSYFLYLLMEFTMGGDLMKHLTSRERFPESVCRFYVAELVLALAYVHETLQCAHRDIKPENILLDADGHVKLGDFGLSKFVGPPVHTVLDFSQEALGVSRVTRSPQTKWRESCRFHERILTGAGTTDYMAPEIHRQGRRRRRLGGPLPQDDRGGFQRRNGGGIPRLPKNQERSGYNRTVDWWSVGVVLFDMLFGKLPFSDEYGIGRATTERIIHWKQHLAKLPVDCPVSRDCEHFLRQLLAEPEDRIQTAAEAARHPWLKTVDWKALRKQKPPLTLDTTRLGLNNFDLVSLHKFTRWELKKKEEAERAHVFIRVKVPSPPHLQDLLSERHQPSCETATVPTLDLRRIIHASRRCQASPSPAWRTTSPRDAHDALFSSTPHAAFATYRSPPNRRAENVTIERLAYTFRESGDHRKCYGRCPNVENRELPSHHQTARVTPRTLFTKKKSAGNLLTWCTKEPINKSSGKPSTSKKPTQPPILPASSNRQTKPAVTPRQEDNTPSWTHNSSSRARERLTAQENFTRLSSTARSPRHLVINVQPSSRPDTSFVTRTPKPATNKTSNVTVTYPEEKSPALAQITSLRLQELNSADTCYFAEENFLRNNTSCNVPPPVCGVVPSSATRLETLHTYDALPVSTAADTSVEPNLLGGDTQISCSRYFPCSQSSAFFSLESSDAELTPKAALCQHARYPEGPQDSNTSRCWTWATAESCAYRKLHHDKEGSRRSPLKDDPRKQTFDGKAPNKTATTLSGHKRVTHSREEQRGSNLDSLGTGVKRTISASKPQSPSPEARALCGTPLKTAAVSTSPYDASYTTTTGDKQPCLRAEHVSSAKDAYRIPINRGTTVPSSGYPITTRHEKKPYGGVWTHRDPVYAPSLWYYQMAP